MAVLQTKNAKNKKTGSVSCPSFYFILPINNLAESFLLFRPRLPCFAKRHRRTFSVIFLQIDGNATYFFKIQKMNLPTNLSLENKKRFN